MTGTRLHPQFIGGEEGRIFVLLRRPAEACQECVLVVPPFAEEMNKSRRMISLVAHALVQRGKALALPDLYGTGDSEGDFEDATWERWVTDIVRTQQWCEQQGFKITGMIGARLGCALGVEALSQCSASLQTVVFWQPVVDGARALDQFLRLRTAATLMSNDARETIKELRARLRNGETIEVAGYPLSPALAAALEEVRLDVSSRMMTRIHWMEVARSADAPVPVPTAKAIESLRSAGRDVVYHQIAGDPFWSATEIVTIQALVERTAAAFCEAE